MSANPAASSALPGSASIVVPTLNGGRRFARVLRAIGEQQFSAPFDLLVIDSGSTDGTLEVARQHRARVLSIPQREFSHGLTRALGVRETDGDVIVMLTQDAVPRNERWLAKLLEPFEQSEVAGAYSNQVPRAAATPFVRHRLQAWSAAASEPRTQHLDDQLLDDLPPRDRLTRIAFDNVSSAVRREVALAYPPRAVSFGEDLDWALRVLQVGWKIVYQPLSQVEHSHNRSMSYEFRRVFLDHENLNRLIGLHCVPRLADLLSCTWSGMRELRQAVATAPYLNAAERLRWRIQALPYAFSQNLAQYLGARASGRRHIPFSPYRWLYRQLRKGI